MVKAVIFDMDGVLIDTEKWLNKYWRQAAAEAGYDMTVEDGLAIRSLAAKYAAPFLQERFGADFPYWTIRERRKELMKAHIAANGIDKKPGVDELLDYLRAHRIKTAVATATDPARTKDYLTRIGIYDKFDRIVCATMVENGKPKPDIYLYACEQIGKRLRTVLRSKIPPTACAPQRMRESGRSWCRIWRNRMRTRQNASRQKWVHSLISY